MFGTLVSLTISTYISKKVKCSNNCNLFSCFGYILILALCNLCIHCHVVDINCYIEKYLVATQYNKCRLEIKTLADSYKWGEGGGGMWEGG